MIQAYTVCSYWSESGELVTLACEDTFYVLRFSRENYIAALQAGEVDEDGVEAAFEVVVDINESVRTGQWVGDSFLYTNGANRLNYLVGSETYTIAHLDQPGYVLGYLPRDGRVYVADKDVNVVSYALSLSVVEYQTLVLRGDLDTANAMLPDIPDDQKNKIARFLEGQGYKEEALDVATDPEHRFELALGLVKLDIALDLARRADVEHKWKTVGDAALAGWDVALAEECFVHAKDLGSLLLLYSATASADGLRRLAGMADAAAANNVAFSCLWLLADVDGCVDLLLRTGRTAEAVLFAQTYKPSRAPAVVRSWKEALEKGGKGKVARMLGVPPGADGEEGDRDMFPEWDEWLSLEREGVREEELIDVGDGAGEDAADAVETGQPADDGEGDEAQEEVNQAPPQTETEM